MRLTVELHKALFGKDKIKLNQWELEFLTKLWVSYLNVGKFDKVTYKQKEVLKKIIKKYRSKKERLAQQRTKWGAVERESWLLQQWENIFIVWFNLHQNTIKKTSSIHFEHLELNLLKFSPKTKVRLVYRQIAFTLTSK